MRKIIINFVLGGLSLVAIIGGILWFFLIEMSPESALAVVGGLGLLFGWFQTREDKKDQAQDKADIINVIRTEKQLIAVETSEFEQDTYREVDLKFLSEVWNVINSKKINNLVDELQVGTLSKDFYRQFQRYMFDRQELPEYDFLGKKRKQMLQEFDEKLITFDRQFYHSHGLVDFHGVRTYLPDYKRDLTWEIQQLKEREFDKTIELLIDMQAKHRELVTFLTQEFPEFQFRQEADFWTR